MTLFDSHAIKKNGTIQFRLFDPLLPSPPLRATVATMTEISTPSPPSAPPPRLRSKNRIRFLPPRSFSRQSVSPQKVRRDFSCLIEFDNESRSRRRRNPDICPSKQTRDIFTCGRRHAGLLVTPGVVVVVVGVGVVVVGGGTNFYTWALPETMYGPEKFKSRTPYFCHFSSFYFKSPCMVLMPMYGPEGGGHTPFQNCGVRLRLQTN